MVKYPTFYEQHNCHVQAGHAYLGSLREAGIVLKPNSMPVLTGITRFLSEAEQYVSESDRDRPQEDLFLEFASPGITLPDRFCPSYLDRSKSFENFLSESDNPAGEKELTTLTNYLTVLDNRGINLEKSKLSLLVNSGALEYLDRIKPSKLFALTSKYGLILSSCAQCQKDSRPRYKVAKSWISDPGENLSISLNIKNSELSHGLCESCFEKAMASIN